MKKTSKIISSVLIAIFILSNCVIPAFALSSCLESHFGKLHTTGRSSLGNEIFRTPPSENTCPYVAMSLLLTFYDSYWNDRFVDDQYEWNVGTYDSSTDILVDTFAPIPEANDWKSYVDELGLPSDTDTYPYYSAYAMEHINDYLEPYLISIGRGLGFHPATDETLGLTVEETVDVLQDYLIKDSNDSNDEGIFNDNEIEVKYLKENDGHNIVTKMKEIINKGFPVIYSGKTYVTTIDESGENDNREKKGHQLIAYGINDSGDVLLHTGWKYQSYTTLNTTEYNINRAIIWIELKGTLLTHTHTETSGNYIDSETGNPLCACQIYSEHPEHENNHLFVDDFDAENHFQTCNCGEMINVSSHDMVYSYYSSTKHIELCRECDYVNKKANHTYITPSTFTSEGHFLECPCGAVSSTVEAHSDGRCEMKSTYSHNVYCKCGYLIREDYHNMGSINIRYEKCSDCEYIRDKTASGEIIKGIGDDTPHLTE